MRSGDYVTLRNRCIRLAALRSHLCNVPGSHSRSHLCNSPLPLRTPAALSPESPTLHFFLIHCIGSRWVPPAPRSPPRTEKRQERVVAEVESGWDATAKENANDGNQKQATDHQAEEEEEGNGEEEMETVRRPRPLRAGRVAMLTQMKMIGQQTMKSHT